MRQLLTIVVALCLFGSHAWADAQADLEAGKAAYARGDDRAAVASFDNAISGGLQGARLAEALRERGRSYLRMGDLVKSAQDLNRAIELNPEDGEAYGLRCRANLGLNNGKLALADLEAASVRTQTSVPMHICRGEILYAARRFGESLAAFNEAMRLGANDYQFRTSRALAMIWAGKPDDAIADLDRLIEASQGVRPGTRARLFEARARAKIFKGNLDGALADATQAIQVSGEDGVLAADRHAFRARVHVLRAEFDQAIADVNTALGMLTDVREEATAPLYATRAGAHASQGELEQAIADFGQAIAKGKKLPGPQVATWYVGRARANIALGRRPAAGQDFDNAVRLDPKNPAILVERGDNRLHQGNATAAMADYDAALRLDPKNLLAASRRGWALLEQGRYNEAIAAAAKVVQMQPENSLGYWDRGVFRFLAGRFADAERDFRDVVRLAPKNVHAMMWGHIARARAGKPDRNVLASQFRGQEPTRWPGPLVQVFLGASKPDRAMATAEVAEPGLRRRRECEAHFYLGQVALLRNDRAAAEEHFRQAIATDVRDFVEYTAARIELQRLGG